MPTEQQIRRRLSDLLEAREPRRPVRHGLMGDSDGILTVPNRPDYTYVRLEGQEPVPVLNHRVVPVASMPVVCGFSPEQPTVFQVLSVSFQQFDNLSGNPSTPLHAASHTRGGYDEIFVQKQQYQPLASRGQSTPDLTIHVESDYYLYGDDIKFFAGGDFDLSTYVPSASLFRYVTVYVEGSTNTLRAVPGSTYSIFWPAGSSYDRIPDTPAGGVPVAAVYVPGAATALTTYDNIFDIRAFNQAVAGHQAGTLPAASVTVTDAGSYYNATDAEAALNEIGAKLHQVIFAIDGDLAVYDDRPPRVYNRMGQNRTIENVFPALSYPATGAAAIFDIHRDGTTIFTTQANRPQIDAGQYEGAAAIPDITTWAHGSYLQLAVDQVGSVTPGSYAAIHVVYRGN